MTKTDQAESAAVGVTPAAVLTSAFLKGAEIWMNGHGEVLAAMEAVMADWIGRRREAIDVWSRSFEKMCECRDLVDLARVQQAWLCDTIRLTASDIRVLAGDTAASCTGTAGVGAAAGSVGASGGALPLSAGAA